MIIRNTMLAFLLTAPTVVIAALIGWRGLGVVMVLLMLVLVAEQVRWSGPMNGRDWLDFIWTSGAGLIFATIAAGLVVALLLV